MKMIFTSFSFVCLFAFLVMFGIMLSPISLGSFGPFFLIIMGLLPLMGMVSALLGRKGLVKPVGVILNGALFTIIAFIFALMGMGED